MSDHNPAAQSQIVSPGKSWWDGVLRFGAAVLSGIRGLFRGRVILILLLLIVGFAWFLGKPNGELYLAGLPDVLSKPEKKELASRLFQSADATIEKAASLYGLLPLAVDFVRHDVPIPPPAPPSEGGIKKFLPDFDIDATLEQESSRISLQVNALEMLQATYSVFGYSNFYIVFRSVDQVACAPGVQGKCWQIVAQYWPSLMHPERLIGNEDQLAEDLAVLVVRGALRNEGDEWRRHAAPADPPPFIMAAETPSTMLGLEATAKGMQMLKLGKSHPECQGKSEEECIEAARALFQLSIDRERTLNPVASFGAALIEIDAAQKAARRLESDVRVESHLNQAEVWANRAMQSEFLRTTVALNGDNLKFGLLDLGGLVPDPQLVDLSRRFACALADYRRAQWDGCIAKVGKPSDFPPALQPYVDAAKIDASLGAPAAGLDPKAELRKLSARIAGLEAQAPRDANMIFMLRRVLLRHACGRPERFDPSGFDDLIRRTLDYASSRQARSEVFVEAASCFSGQTFPAGTDVEAVRSAAALMPDEERERFMFLLSQHRLRSGDLEGAFDFAKEALQLPWAGAYIRTAVEFQPLLAGAKGEDLITASFAPSPKYAGLESCQDE